MDVPSTARIAAEAAAPSPSPDPEPAREPPAEIAEVYASIKRDMQREEQSRALGRLTATMPYLDRTVRMPDGRTLRMADVLAAEAYVRLQRRVGKRD